MRSVLPGKPRAKLQAICTADWDGLRLVLYITGSAVVILSGPHKLLQTIYHDEHSLLDAVTIDEATGKIAICCSNDVIIYKPFGRKEGVLRWSFESSFQIPGSCDAALTLSWGSEEELLVGSSSLRLYQTARENIDIWNRRLPKPVRIASFSYDASLIASTGLHDRLVKLWRRQSFGSSDTRFDFTYLPHPTAVTALHWRRPHKHEHLVDNVLFTVCADSKVRIWAAKDPHALQVLQLWGQIDMQEAIQPRGPGLFSSVKERYAFFLDSKDLTTGTEQTFKFASERHNQGDHALEHLTEVFKTSPEVCVVLDRRGNMSAWGLESVGCKTRKNNDKFNIAHVENVNLSFPTGLLPEEANVQFLAFCSPDSASPFNLLVHHFDGRIIWYESKLDEVLDPCPRPRRLHTKASWTGHDGIIKKIIRSASGKALISRTVDNQCLIWKQGHDRSELALVRSSSLNCPEHIHRSCLLEEGDIVINLHHHSVTLWDARSVSAKQVASCTFESKGKPLCLLQLPHGDVGTRCLFVATITSKMEAIVWKVEPSEKFGEKSNGTERAIMSEFCTSDLGLSDDLAFVLPVDPAGSITPASDFLDTFRKDLAIAYTNDGLLRAWTARVDLENTSVNWLVTSTIETDIDMPSLASGSSIRKIALVDTARTGLTIWDPWSSQLEFDTKYEPLDTIQDLDWSSTPDDQSLLAVGFPYKIVVLAQIRYDYMNVGPSWAPVREISIKELTSHPIGDSTWLGSGNLAVGAGNQLYVYDKAVDTSDDMVSDLSLPRHEHRSLNILDLVTYLNGPLPVFHPQFLAQCLLAGKVICGHQIIINLYKALRFFTPGDELDSFVSLSTTDFFTEQEEFSYAAKKEMQSSYADFVKDDDPETVTEELAASLNESLTKIAIPQLSSLEQIHLADIVECVATVEKHRRSMDENAMRYLLFFRQYMLRKGQTPNPQVGATWREIIWAYHSNSQDILLDLVSRQFHGRMLWSQARESGVFMWMTDLTALRGHFETIARNEYTKTDEKNPTDCSLYYLALRKKSVLLGLWRMAAWNREQAGTQKLLRNDFSDPRWKTAALKNAYALLGKRRFEYAAAFFLLADRLQDAVNVCAHQMGDLQLAVAVARVYEGDESAVLRALLKEKVLPQAATEGNRWMATWAFWMLGRRDMAVGALISPVHTLVPSSEQPSRHSKSYLSNDPALSVLYKQLRTQIPRGCVSPRKEWDFVIQNARVYDRMGCDLLALGLVRNWEFLEQPLGQGGGVNGTTENLEETRRGMSALEVSDTASAEGEGEEKGMSGGGKAKPTQFKEPEASSLLDSFGF
ncbi:regulator of (H+)-ATPase in vacuolar membrane [Lecanora helva]